MTKADMLRMTISTGGYKCSEKAVRMVNKHSMTCVRAAYDRFVRNPRDWRSCAFLMTGLVY